jgi:hypothetical protein
MKPTTLESIAMISYIGLIAGLFATLAGCSADWRAGGLKGFVFYLRLLFFLWFPFIVLISVCGYVLRRQDRHGKQNPPPTTGER